ncbi:type II toxin-antitoxin system RelE/ParE family toxin [Candidatus Shapirobacteria bacterium]|nr:type II toxin-antitoxin system RelE/ParE family toxin [Candidatus Shapirobacteria bacterium]
MNYQVVLFESTRGDKPVYEFISKFDDKTISKFTRLATLLSQFGLKLSMPYSKKISRDLYELRLKGKNEIRVLYCFHKQDFYLLHAFQKKKMKTPQKEIEIAQNRLTQI